MDRENEQESQEFDNHIPSSSKLSQSSRLQKLIRCKRFYIYLCHGLSAWGDRMWAFAVGLFLVEIYQNSLQLTAIYGFVKGGSVLLFGALIGDWVDRTQRLHAARVTLVINNLSIILCAVIIILLFNFNAFIRTYQNGILHTFVIIAIILLAVIAHLGSTGNKIIIQKDWIVVICGSDTDKLTRMNANLRRIDLVSNTLAPLAVGQIMTFGSPIIGAIFIAIWNLFSMGTEYFLFWKVYKRVPGLAFKGGVNSTEQSITPRRSKVNIAFANFITFYQSWYLYMRQSVVLAGLSFSCLYLSVFGFDNVTVGYIYSQGMTESLVGVAAGLGALFGIIGTFAFQVLKRRIGLAKTGLLSVNYYNIIVILCLASVWAPGSPFDLAYLTCTGDCGSANNNSSNIYNTSESNSSSFPGNNVTVSTNIDNSLPTSYTSFICFMIGMVIGRSGMWMSDLGINQQFLENVEETARGKVNGVQTSLNMLMDMIKFGLVIALPNPKTFGILIIISFTFISLASILNILHVIRIKRRAPKAENIKASETLNGAREIIPI